MNAPLILSISVFITTILIFVGMFSYLDARKRQRQVVGKIKAADESLILDTEKEYDGSGQERRRGFFQQFISSLGNRIKPKDEEKISSLRVSLLQAGYRSQKAVIVFFGYRVFFAVLLPAIFFVVKVSFAGTMLPGAMMSVAALLAIAGYFLPNLWLKTKINGRQQKMLEGFPDALDLMVVCVEAGMGLDAAINRVGEEMKLRNAVVSEEFRLMGLELRAGKIRREALRNLGMRTGLD